MKNMKALEYSRYMPAKNFRNNEEIVSDQTISGRIAGDKQPRVFAKFGAGRWYAILPEMEESFLKAGADVSTLAVEMVDEELTS